MSYRAIILTMKKSHEGSREFQTRAFRDDDELDGLRAITETFKLMKKQAYEPSDVVNFRGIEVSQ